MLLTYAQKSQLYREGYTNVPGVVPRHMIDSTLRAISHSLGEGLDPEKTTAYSSVSFCPELQKSPVILDTFASARRQTKTPALATMATSAGATTPTAKNPWPLDL